MLPLPIDALLPSLLESLRTRRVAVVVAPPGSGKSTRIPPVLLDSGLSEGRILVLQPRRVAARLVARRIASERGCPVGGEVGYRIRFEDRTSARTRIEILTEGLLTRRLQADPFLDGVSWVLLDEFHERSLHADLALALLREVRETARPDLGIVVLSATLQADPVAAFLGAPVLTGEGRPYAVDIRYSLPDDRSVIQRCALAVRQALVRHPEGHVLAFLPGIGEIRRVAEALGDVDADVLPLHGSLPGAEQDRALAPCSRRKVVLSTNIAETSVTLEGVRTVVDAGLARQPAWDPALGLERLETVRIARDAADQRAGRAGRTGPGTCYRLWTMAEHHGRAEATVPEIARVDLTRTLLEILAWGEDPRNLRWFERPPEAALARAETVLDALGARAGTRLSRIGRTLLALPLEPRLGRLVLAGIDAGCPRTAATLAALVSERDPFHETPPEGSVDSDLRWRLDALDGRARPGGDPAALASLRRVRDDLLDAVRVPRGTETPPDDETLARVLLAAFPDRVAVRRVGPEERYIRVGGRGAILGRASALRGEPLILAVSLTGGAHQARSEDRVDVAVALRPEWLPLATDTRVEFDPDREAVVAREVRRYLDLDLEEKPGGTPDPQDVSQMLEAAARRAPHRVFAIDDDAASLLARLRFLSLHRPDLGLPGFWDLCDLLPELCIGRRSFAQLREVPLALELRRRLPRVWADTHAPERVQVPSGAWIRLVYPFEPWGPRFADDVPADSPLRGPPVLAARIQQLFGMRQTPRVAGVPVQVHLLAPNGRPAQVTQDLESFWANTWAEVRRDLRGRYPRHAWPEDPATAIPEDRPRRRG